MKRPILLVTMNGDGPTTGFASRVWWLANAMCKRGETVYLLRFYPAFRAQASWKTQADASQLHLLEIPVPPISRFALARWFAMLLAGIFIQVYARWMGAALIQAEAHEAACAALRFLPGGVPVVVDFHGACVEEACNRRGVCPTDASVKWLQDAERLAVSRATACLVVSPRMIDYLQEKHHHTIRAALHEVPISIDAGFFRPLAREAARQSLGIAPDVPLLVYCGGAQEYQCLEEMRQLLDGLVALLPDVHLLVVSRDVNVFQEKFRGQWHRVTLRSASHKDVPSLLMAGDAGLLLRRNQLLNRVACPTKFAEYLACGLPVITTPWAGHAEALVTRYQAGMVIEHVDDPSLQQIAKMLKPSLVMAERQRLQQVAANELNGQVAEAALLACHTRVVAANKQALLT